MEDFVTYEQAVKLKELGFDLECNYWYYNVTKQIIFTHGCEWFYFEDMTKAPTLAQAQKWLREVKQLEVNSTYDVVCKEGWFFYKNDLANVCIIDSDKMGDNFYASYEEALSAGIDNVLEMLKEND